MILKRITVLIMTMFLLASCATGAGQSAKDKATAATVPTSAAADSGFSLPDVEDEKPIVPQKASKQVTAVPNMESVFIEDSGQQQYIILNFDNTDIETILATFGELLGINYILTPGITGTVTIQSYSRVPTANLFNIFQSILEINGLAAIKDGGFYRIVPIDTAKTLPMDVTSETPDNYELDSSFITQLISLENVKASEVSAILKELTPRGANLIVYEPANLLIVTALPSTLKKFTKIIEALDVDSIDSGSIRTFVYYVENGNAVNLEKILNTVYASKSDKNKQQSKATASRIPSLASKDAGTLPGDLGEITISAYQDINALLIKCSPRSYVALLKVLKNIDVPPKQVLIDVMIAEVTLGSQMSYGIDWMLKFKSGNIAGMSPPTFLSDTGTILTPGEIGNSSLAGKFTAVSSGTMGSDSYIGLFTALAQDNNLNVLASPNILAMDNKEAEIKIGSEIPIATSTTASTEGITTTAQIQYKTVGTILTVTPHITEKGNVSMKIVVESSGVGVNTLIGTGEYPSFSTRKATTNALVKDGHTLFIGGLISSQKTSSKSGIPFLNKIPIIGYFFGGQSWKNDKTELFVMVTPHVINNADEADELTNRFARKINNIKKTILKDKSNEGDEDTTIKVTIKGNDNVRQEPNDPNLPPKPYMP